MVNPVLPLFATTRANFCFCLYFICRLFRRKSILTVVLSWNTLATTKIMVLNFSLWIHHPLPVIFAFRFLLQPVEAANQVNLSRQLLYCVIDKALFFVHTWFISCLLCISSPAAARWGGKLSEPEWTERLLCFSGEQFIFTIRFPG